MFPNANIQKLLNRKMVRALLFELLYFGDEMFTLIDGILCVRA